MLMRTDDMKHNYLFSVVIKTSSFDPSVKVTRKKKKSQTT